MARDRKRAKQRQQRRGPARAGGSEQARHASSLTRADLPGALEHVGDVDEFDAAIVRGAEGVTVPDAPLEEQPAAANGGGNGSSAVPVRSGARAPAQAERQSLPARAMGFLRSSWAELQRVQWPNRSQVTQATAVVLGFVAVAGVYFGLADYVAKGIVEAIL